MLTILLPTRNEVATIGRMIDEIRALDIGAMIVVLDHKSTDGTREVVQSKKDVFLVDEPEKGKGVAVRHFLETNPPGNLVMIDADCTYPVARIPEAVAALDAGSDVVMGYRRWPEKGSMSLLHAIGNSGLTLIAYVLGYDVPDICTGFWGFRDGVASKFRLVSNGFTLEADLATNALKNRCKITPIPIEYAARPDGSTAKLTTLDGVKIAWFLLMSRLGRR